MDERYVPPATRPAPITEHQIVTAAEIEEGIRERVERYEGEELIRSLAEFFVLSLVEVVTIKDPSPSRLDRLPEEMQAFIKGLTPAIPAARHDDS